MFFAYPSIANQLSSRSNIALPGISSFGNAYSGTIIKRAYTPSLPESLRIIEYVTDSHIEKLRYADTLIPNYGILLDTNWITNSQKEIAVWRNYTLINQLQGQNLSYISVSAYEAFNFITLPPSFVVPLAIDNIYPDVFCAPISSTQLPLFVQQLIGSTFLVSNTRLELQTLAIWQQAAQLAELANTTNSTEPIYGNKIFAKSTQSVPNADTCSFISF